MGLEALEQRKSLTSYTPANLAKWVVTLSQSWKPRLVSLQNQHHMTNIDISMHVVMCILCVDRQSCSKTIS
jgi:hypothetical protein